MAHVRSDDEVDRVSVQTLRCGLERDVIYAEPDPGMQLSRRIRPARFPDRVHRRYRFSIHPSGSLRAALLASETGAQADLATIRSNASRSNASSVVVRTFPSEPT